MNMIMYKTNMLITIIGLVMVAFNWYVLAGLLFIGMLLINIVQYEE